MLVTWQGTSNHKLHVVQQHKVRPPNAQISHHGGCCDFSTDRQPPGSIPPGIQREGDGDLTGGHHVNRDLALSENVEHGGQEPKLAQHARGDYVQQRDLALEDNAGHQGLAHVALLGNEGAIC